jgi:hypothetical protein
MTVNKKQSSAKMIKVKDLSVGQRFTAEGIRWGYMGAGKAMGMSGEYVNRFVIFDLETIVETR